eukprot:CAMPEP_0172745760 /NCGR_PEP_ID=MMETSP1074-20121228/138747_1 /TAXON_ID=2916 /ORGANISM="Ceratium fusus, Strain PA161109" /LENGTH=66 /DNA_ID=CAMNT_0013577007 /DNA_START=25 /DNA_END=222 /DNA_ORIENTATION=-
MAKRPFASSTDRLFWHNTGSVVTSKETSHRYQQVPVARLQQPKPNPCATQYRAYKKFAAIQERALW